MKKHKCTVQCEGCDYFRREYIGQKEKLKCMLDYPCKDYADSINESFQRWYELGFSKGYNKALEKLRE